MIDMLVRLYALPESGPAPDGVVLRRPLAAEAAPLCAWIEAEFGGGWPDEARAALGRMPPTCLIAVAGGAPVGFAAWDVAALGMFGPLGVAAASRRSGVGTALVRTALGAMRAQGYAYAVIGGVVDPGFYARAAGAMAVEGSERGLFGHLLRPSRPVTSDGDR